MNYIQLYDAPNPSSPTINQLIYPARSVRLLPGSGEIDLVGMLSALPQGKVYSAEVSRETKSSRLSPREGAEEALFCAKSVVDRVAQTNVVG